VISETTFSVDGGEYTQNKTYLPPGTTQKRNNANDKYKLKQMKQKPGLRAF